LQTHWQLKAILIQWKQHVPNAMLPAYEPNYAELPGQQKQFCRPYTERKNWFLGSEKLRSVVLPILCICCFFILAQQPPGGQGLFIHGVSRSHKTTHHSR
jgi:hypothetical protein